MGQLAAPSRPAAPYCSFSRSRSSRGLFSRSPPSPAKQSARPRRIIVCDLRLTKVFSLPVMRVMTTWRAVLQQGGLGNSRHLNSSAGLGSKGSSRYCLSPHAGSVVLLSSWGRSFPRQVCAPNSVSGSADHFPKECARRALEECQK